jgi:hypothetical protein
MIAFAAAAFATARRAVIKQTEKSGFGLRRKTGHGKRSREHNPRTFQISKH